MRTRLHRTVSRARRPALHRSAPPKRENSRASCATLRLYSVVRERAEPKFRIFIRSSKPPHQFDPLGRESRASCQSSAPPLEVAPVLAIPCETQKRSGAERDRTDDLRLAKPALSQLSYSPSRSSISVGQGRLELPTSRLSGVCSNHLSYWPGLFERAGARSKLRLRVWPLTGPSSVAAN